MRLHICTNYIIGSMHGRKTLLIKGMVCKRCITVLRSSLEALPVSVENISLGKVTVSGFESSSALQGIEEAIRSLDFELVESKERKLITEIKKIISETINRQVPGDARMKISSLLAEKLNMSYDSLSSVFSKEEGITIATYIIYQRVAKIKEYLASTDLSLTEIAFLMGYSSVFHLSRQFKELTGINASDYRRSSLKSNYPLLDTTKRLELAL